MRPDRDWRTELRALLPELKARYGIRRLYVFGSWARGEAREDSDLDLLVEFATPPTFFDLVHLEMELGERLGLPVHAVTTKSLRPNVRKKVERDLVEV